MLLFKPVELFFRLPVIQREKTKIKTKISYQLRPYIAVRATEETRPHSLRPVLLNKLGCLFLPYPELPDNHILSAGHSLPGRAFTLHLGDDLFGHRARRFVIMRKVHGERRTTLR